MNKFFTSFFKQNPTQNPLPIDKNYFEGDFSNIDELSKAINEKKYLEIRQYAHSNIPRKLRAHVWYSLLIRPKSANEIWCLVDENQKKQYWNDIETFQIESNDFLYSEDSNVIDWDVARTFPTKYEDIYQLQQIRNMLRRILKLFLWNHPKGYFQGLNDIVSIIIMVLLDNVTKQQVNIIIVDGLSENELNNIEATTYAFLDSIYRSLSVNIIGIEKDIHAIGLLNNFIELLKVMNSKAIDINQQFLKQQTWRWFVCLFCREFSVERVIVIWDRFITDINGNGFKAGILCFACALIEDILSQAEDPNNMEEVNKITRNYCNDMSDETFIKILNQSVYIREEYYQKFIYKN